MTDCLRASLSDLADQVELADLYDGAVHRSRRIARREATIGTAAAVCALALLFSGLWWLPDEKRHEPPAGLPSRTMPAIGPSFALTPSASPREPAPTHHRSTKSSPTPRRKNRPQVATSTPAAKSRALADLPGHVFYQQAGSRPDVVRMSPEDGDVTTVLPDAPSAVGISPDGSSIAYAEGSDLLVAHTTDDQPAQQVATGVSTTAQAPAWSPDGTKLLVDADFPAILQVGSGTLTPLGAALADGKHFRWSGDGYKLVYATSYCGLKVAGNGADSTVPVLGDRQPADNPDGLAACKPTSVDATGGRVTVPLQTTDDTGTDGSDTADAVVDTVTGDVVPLPVAGSVVGAVFAPDGNLLVRTRHDDTSTLSLFASDGTLLVQAEEPAAVRDLDLLAYTR